VIGGYLRKLGRDPGLDRADLIVAIFPVSFRLAATGVTSSTGFTSAAG
jgi:hypothetical protein